MTSPAQSNWNRALPEIILERYRVVRQLGAGGMGEAYLADDMLLRRQVVIKRMSPQMAGNPLDRSRFLSEAKRAAAINNPHVVQIYDVLEISGELLLILEYVDGGNLRTVTPNKLPLERFFTVALQIADGVAAAHAARVVHCDLKPENLLITSTGTIKVLDFGLARPTSKYDAATISVVQPRFAGTPGYMAPEMVREQEIDERADIFALGVVFYELLTGISPFKCTTLLDTLHKTVHEEAPPVTLADGNIPPEIDWILGKMLAKDRDERYPTVREIVTDLTACQRKLHGGSGITRLSVTAPRVKRISRRQVVVVCAALVAVMAIAGGYVSIKRRSEGANAPVGPQYRSVAVLPFHVIGSAPSDLPYADGICGTLTSKLARIAAGHGLQVTPASEVRRRSLTSAAEARQQLGADLVFEGQLQRAGPAVRITYTLVDTRSMSQLRSDEFNATLNDPFTMEDKIVSGALTMLNVQLEAAELQSLNRRGTTNAAAYDLFLIGSGYLREYEDPGNVERAIDSFQGALLKDASYAQANAALGRAYWAKYQMHREPSLVDAARAACQSAVRKDATLPDSHLCLGIVAGGTGEYEDAVKELEAVINAEPSNDIALRELASIYEKTKAPAEAEQIYKRSIAAQPHYWAGYSRLAGFYARQGRYEEAAAQYRLALEQSPGNAVLYYGLGGVCIYQGKYNDAVENLKKAVELQPTADAYRNMGQAYLHQRNFEAAITAFKKAVALSDREYILYSALGDAYYWSKSHAAEAPAAYRQSIKLSLEQQRVNPRNEEINLFLAYNSAAIGDESHALEYLQRVQKAMPRDSEIMFFTARIYARLDHPEEAAGWLIKAIENGYSRADILDCPDLDALRSRPAVRKAMAP